MDERSASMVPRSRKVQRHYDVADLCERIKSALAGAGRDLENLTTDDLFFFDEVHIGGRRETRLIAENSRLRGGDLVLDIGCGVGGPARTLAHEFGCRVIGIDLTRSFCRAADMLTRLVGLEETASFVNADAVELPFIEYSFDTVWMQHTALNIENKRGLFSEIHRVLKSGGKLILHEVISGETDRMHYPVFWAAGDETNHLCTEVDLKTGLEDAGLKVLLWEDVTERSLKWYKRLKARSSSKASKPPLDISVIVERDVPAKIKNLVRNLDEGSIRVIQATLTRVA